MHRNISVFLLVITLFLINLTAQTNELNLSDYLPRDNKVTVGTLDNGLTYFIRENKKPENRAYIRLVVNAGSILEDENQRGLAHFMEHMEFNGTKNFSKHEIINFMERIGMRFGPEVNAYTGFDETVYMLELPMDSAGVFETGIKILRDWATNATLDPKEIDKERGVIIEEWRGGRGAQARLRDKQFPVIFKNSKYAERLPIGKKEIIETFDHELLKKFYSDWYRPDLMAVVAVGDFNAKEVETMIKKYFSDIPVKENAKERKNFEVPSLYETRFSVESDKEQVYTIVQTYFLKEVEKESTIGDYRNQMLSRLFSMMLNERFHEIMREANPPFLNAYAGDYNLVRTKDTFSLTALVKENDINKGLEALITQAEKIRQFGFTPTELERAKKVYARSMKKLYEERDKMESNKYASAYTSVYLDRDAIVGVENRYSLFTKMIDGISLEEVNKTAAENIESNNRVVIVSAPEKETIVLPASEELNSVLSTVMNKQLSAYEDNVAEGKLIENIPAPKNIVKENYIKELDITELELENGARVILKPTDFKNDEILLSASSPGGTSLLPDDEYRSGIAAPLIVNESGVGKFTNMELRKKLAGKVVSLNPWIGELREGFEGTSSPEDLEYLFKLLYMFYYEPRFDSTAYISFVNRMKGYLENRDASPDIAFQDTVSVTMSNYHFRSLPWSQESIDEISLTDTEKIYKERFADASDFTFYFVGNFDLEKIKEYCRVYIGNLPGIHRTESWKDINLRYPTGRIEKVVKSGIEPKSNVMIKYTGNFNWEPKTTYYMQSVVDYLDIKLREVIREDKSGTYGVSVWCNPTRYPHEDYEYSITFGCDPERVDELTGEVLTQIDSLRNYTPDISYVEKIKEQHLRKRETDLKTNRFWLSAIHNLYVNKRDPKVLLDFEKTINTLTPEILQKTAKEYFNDNNYVRVVLYPENE